jgi:phage terminase small subunit
MADGEASGKLSEQQERFCQFIVEGKTQREAYRLAGYKCSNEAATDASASRLLSSAKIAARVQELRKPIADKAAVTLDWLLEQAKEVLEAAKTDRAHAASVAAIKELGVLSGERVETRHNLNQDANDTSELSRADLLDIARAGRPGTPAKGSGQGKPDRVHPVH